MLVAERTYPLIGVLHCNAKRQVRRSGGVGGRGGGVGEGRSWGRGGGGGMDGSGYTFYLAEFILCFSLGYKTRIYINVSSRILNISFTTPCSLSPKRDHISSGRRETRGDALQASSLIILLMLQLTMYSTLQLRFTILKPQTAVHQATNMSPPNAEIMVLHLCII